MPDFAEDAHYYGADICKKKRQKITYVNKGTLTGPGNCHDMGAGLKQRLATQRLGKFRRGRGKIAKRMGDNYKILPPSSSMGTKAAR